jgi:SAM-dependent methyltransferase
MATYPEGVQLEARPCPLGCQEADAFVLEGWDRIHGIAGKFRIVRCEKCGLMRTNPRPTPATIGAYYPDSYAPYLTSEGARLPAGRKAKLLRWLGFEPRPTPPVAPGQLLEIGCASGAYLEQMRRAGWTGTGIEFSDSAAQQARAKGFEVHTGSVEMAPDLSRRFDLIAAWMVLEHLHDPISVLRRLRSWSKPEGYLIGSVPVHGRFFLKVFGNASYDLHLPNHLYHFSPETLRQLLHAGGWKLERIRFQRNPMTLLRTLQYSAADAKNSKRVARLEWFSTSPGTGKIRMLLAWLLGITRTSGRIEFWARPLSSTSN